MTTVRLATVEDLDAVLAVGHATWPATYEPIAGPDYVRTGLGKWWSAESSLPAIRDGRTLVAEVNGQVAGMASYSADDDEVILWKLYVVPTAQGAGAGTALLSAVEAVAGEHRRVRLAFLAGNDAAQAFYESRGFKVTGATDPGPIGGPDNVWMEKVPS